jgi:hypothetical protein
VPVKGIGRKCTSDHTRHHTRHQLAVNSLNMLDGQYCSFNVYIFMIWYHLSKHYHINGAFNKDIKSVDC